MNGISTSCPLWTCSDNCSGAAACPAWPRWRRPGSPRSPRTAPSRGGGRWCRPPPAWRPPRTAHSRQSDSTTRSGSSQSLKSAQREGKEHRELTGVNRRGASFWTGWQTLAQRQKHVQLIMRTEGGGWRGAEGGGGGKRSRSLLQRHHSKRVSLRISELHPRDKQTHPKSS